MLVMFQLRVAAIAKSFKKSPKNFPVLEANATLANHFWNTHLVFLILTS